MKEKWIVGRFWSRKSGVRKQNSSICHAEFISASACYNNEILKQVQDDGNGGVGLFAGFTLIELLVVVLIIAILAAVALPVYQKAVWKARFVQAKTMATTLAETSKIAYLTNGVYPTRLADMDVNLEIENETCDTARCTYTTKWGVCKIATSGYVDCRVYKNKQEFIRYTINLNANVRFCSAMKYALGRTPTPDDINYQVCAAETKRAPQSYDVSNGNTDIDFKYN